MYVPVDSREHDKPLAKALFFLQVLLQMAHGLLHDLSGLEHKWEDEFPGPELVTHLLHCGQ